MDKILKFTKDMILKGVEGGASKVGELVVERTFFERDKVCNVTFESLQSKINILCYERSSVEERIRKAENWSKKERKESVKKWLERAYTIENEFCELQNNMQTQRSAEEDPIARLYARVNELVEECRYFGELVIDVDMKGDLLLVEKLVGEQFTQITDDTLELMSTDDGIQWIGICGMGGVGKTALAMHINNRLLEDQKCVIWIKVSQQFPLTMLQDKIAKFVGLDLTDEQDERKRASRLETALTVLSSERKNIVIIFDDVWEAINLKMLGVSLSENCCHKLLITTRSHEVCQRIDCQKIFFVKKLEENEGWKLFENELGQDMSLEIKGIARPMVKLCNGLPLGIVTVAKFMKGETDINVWSDKLEELKGPFIRTHKDMERDVFEVLESSFKWLRPSEVGHNQHSKEQLCFLYCSLYSNEDEINTEELIRKFIVEEFLDERSSREKLFRQGRAVLKKLVDCCLLESGSHHDHVRMHDLVRHMALKITEGKIKVIAGQSSLDVIPDDREWTAGLERMSLRNNKIKEIPPGKSPQCPVLSTLLLDGNPLEVISNSFFNFSRIPRLCILDLSRTVITKLPDSLSKMVSLKALFLKECNNLEKVPYLGNLKELRDLDFTGTAIVKVPQGMVKLIKLKFLSFYKANKLRVFPSDLLLKFPDLQSLHLPYCIHVSGKKVASLQHLEEFRGRVEDAINFFEFIKTRTNLVFCIQVQSGSPRQGMNEVRDYDQFILSKYDFNKAENKDVAVLKQSNIRHLKLDACMGDSCLVEDISWMSHPSELESLKVGSCEKMECLLRREQYPGPAPVFSSLIQLEIFRCNNIKKLGFLPSELMKLEKITISYCEQLEEIINVTEENGRPEPENASQIALPKLRSLHLDALPKLKSICNATILCGSIENIVLYGCQTLEKLPLIFESSNCGSLPETLGNILVKEDEREWWQNLELGHPSHCQLFLIQSQDLH